MKNIPPADVNSITKTIREDQRIVIWKPISDLKPDLNNSRTHSKKQIKQIAKSIREFGFNNPILINENNGIIAGHGRLEAAKSIGLQCVPTLKINHLSQERLRAYKLADNRLAELAGWDNELLAIELQSLTELELNFELSVIGFETPEIDLLIQGDMPDDDPADLLPKINDGVTIITRLGDIWQCGPHRIACGDCRDKNLVEKLMNDSLARMIITDPPYNVTVNGHICGLGKHQHSEFVMATGEMSTEQFVAFLSESLTLLAHHSIDGSLHFVFMDWRHLKELLTASEIVYDAFLNLIIWSKTNGGMGSMYRSQHELVLLFKKGNNSHINNIQLGKFGRYRTNVWTYPGVNAFGPERNEALSLHPTVKPVRMITDAILDATNRGDIVLDGFLGSGTTLLAAEQCGRVCRGIELDPKYIDVALRRWIDSGGDEPIHTTTDLSYTKIVDQRLHHALPAYTSAIVSTVSEGSCHG